MTAEGPSLPPPYRAPRPLDPQRHRSLRVAPFADASFAAGLTAIPLGLAELPLAARHYPIVFPLQSGFPMAVTGLREMENLFVVDGQWRPGTYVPAYVRRYPFIFATGVGDQLVLCVDEAASCLSQDEGARLFDDRGGQAEALRGRLEFASGLQGQLEAAGQFVAALNQADLLEPSNADFRLNSGESLRLDGFRILREAQLDALEERTLIDWHRRKWLALGYASLMSQNNWTALMDLAAATNIIKGQS